MLVDTRGLTREIEGKPLKVTFSDGEIAKIVITFVSVYDCHEDCNGFTYEVIESNCPDRYEKKEDKCLYWGKFENIIAWEALGD